MDAEVLALVVRAQDEASKQFRAIQHELTQVAHKADLGGRALSGFHDILRGIGMGIGLSVFSDLAGLFQRITDLLPSMVTKGMAFGDQVHTIQVLTGATAEESSRLIGTFEYLGIGTDNLANKIGILSKNVVLHESVLNALGVSIRNANGGFLNQVEIMDRVRSTLSGMADGTSKLRLEMVLLGRGGADMAEYFKQTDAQTALLNGELDKLGITMNQTAVDNAEKAKKEMNLFGVSMQGLANTLFNDVAPALMSAVDGLVNFVAKNGRAIADFASNVVNFVLGMISGLTGATFATVTFTDQMTALASSVASANTSLDNVPMKTAKAAGGHAALTAEITKEIAAVKALDTAQQKELDETLKGLDGKLAAEVKAMDAARAAHRLDEQRVALATQLADAQQQLAAAQAAPAVGSAAMTAHQTAVEQAADRVSQIVQQQADMEQTVQDDARKAQIAKVKDYLASLVTMDKDATNKRAEHATLLTRETTLASQIAAAQQAGDLQMVSDLTIELEGTKAMAVRVAQEQVNTTRQSSLDAEKARLAALSSAAAAAGGAVGSAISGGANIGQKAVEAMTRNGQNDLAHFRDSSQGAFAGAALAGQKFAADMKAAFATVVDAAKTVIDAISNIKGALDQAKTGLDYLTDPALRAKVNKAAHAQGNDWISVIGSLFDVGTAALVNAPAAGLGVLTGAPPHRAGGGPVSAGMPYMVGEAGPELFSPRTSGTITPSGGGATFHPGAIVVNGASDPAATAQAILLAIKRELTRQNMTFASGY